MTGSVQLRTSRVASLYMVSAMVSIGDSADRRTGELAFIECTGVCILLGMTFGEFSVCGDRDKIMQKRECVWGIHWSVLGYTKAQLPS